MGPKKPKKTKAELEEEKAAREEEERKAKIAEEKRLAEEKERQRLEEERIKAEHKTVRKQELERLQEEYVIILDQQKSREAQLRAEEKKEKEELEWLRYRNPSDDPNAASEREMNTFLSQIEETETVELQPTMESIAYIEKIASMVEDVWSESLANNNHKARSQALQSLESLHRIIHEKLDTATIHLIKYVDKHLNDRIEVNIEEFADKLSFGIWSSQSEMRPNRKSVQLERMGVQVDIPKQILQQHEKYLFRVIRMPIVTYNLRAYEDTSRSANLSDSDLFNASKYVVGDLISFEILFSAAPAHDLRARRWTMRDNSDAACVLRKSAYPSSVACRMLLKIPSDVVISDDMRMAVWDPEAKDWTEEGISDYKYSESTRTVQFYVTTVGTLALVKNRISDFPYKSWKLEPVHDKVINKILVDRLRELDFPTRPNSKSAKNQPKETTGEDGQGTSNAENNESGENIAREECAEGKASDTPEEGLDEEKRGDPNTTTAEGDETNDTANETFHAEGEDNAAPATSAEVADETAEGEQGTTENGAVDNITDGETPPAASNTSVKINRGLTAELTDNAGLIISKKSGEIERHARLTLSTQSHELVVDIVGSSCILIKPELPAFEDLIGIEMPPGCLLRRLQRKGVNLLPTATDLKDSPQCEPKNSELELEVISEVARGASSLEFTSSSWNQSLNTKQIGIKAKESNVYSCFTEQMEYECVLAELDEVSTTYINAPDLGISPGPGGLKFALVFGNEYETKKNYSHVLRPGEISHLELSRVLLSRVTSECMERYNKMNVRFHKTVFTLLNLLKPYSLC